MISHSAKLLLCFTLITTSGTFANGQDSLAIKGGKVLTMAGPPIENGTVLIRDGKIVAVGTDVTIPVEVQLIDASGKVVMPGFVEAHSSEGMSQANETNPNVPYVSVLDTIDPMQSYFEDARRNGVTTVAIVPGNSTMIGGQAAVIKTGGSFVDDMILQRSVGIKISLQPQGSGSRLGHLAALRKELDEAKKNLEPKSDEDSPEADAAQEQDPAEDGQAQSARRQEQGRGGGQAEAARSQPGDPTQPALEQAMRQLLRGELKAFIYCDAARDVPQAIQLVEDYKLKPILVLDKECYKVANQVAAAGYPVVLDSELVFWDADPRTEEESKVVLSEVFRREGVPFVFQVARANNDSLGNNYLWYQAATAVKYGMPVDQALQALTIQPAQWLGVDQFVGSLQPGKDGDVIILTGDPLSSRTWVDQTVVNGRVVYRRQDDSKLQRLLGDLSDTQQ